MKVKEENRIYYIQILRILAISSVIILHSISDFFVDETLFGTRSWWAVNSINGFVRFGVPVFFMISGYLLLSSEKEEKIGGFLKKRFLKILIPFFLWNVIHYSIKCFERKEIFSFSEFFLKFLRMRISYHYWFVYMLLAIYLFVPVIKPLFRIENKKTIWYLLFIILLPTTIAPFINQFFHLWLPLLNQIVEGYTGYFILGYLLGISKFEKIQLRILYSLGILGVLSSIIGTYLFSQQGKMDFFFNGGYQFNSYFVATAVFVFIKTYFSVIKGRKKRYFIDLFGKLSFRVYLMHVIVLEMIDNYVGIQPPWFFVIVRSVGGILICYTIAVIIDKIKYLKTIL